ncbi:transcription factor TFIIIB component B'' homolog [Dermacentor silvarum]|uniref:transcription factor TFIIIB component B'' homolog n=1 Tax=Dermacentor silvarum TaxID=543639 RepID=UPI00189BC391|nr:transcription factor TFIIIB component B'' homolog [Dermacentor silvarum]
MRSSSSSTAAFRHSPRRRGTEKVRPSWVLQEGGGVQSSAAMSTRWSRIKATPNKNATAAELPDIRKVTDAPDTQGDRNCARHTQLTSYSPIVLGVADETFVSRKFEADQAPNRPRAVTGELPVEVDTVIPDNAPSCLQARAFGSEEPRGDLELCQREQPECHPAKNSNSGMRTGKTDKIMEQYIYYNPTGKPISWKGMPSTHDNVGSTPRNGGALGNQTRESTLIGEQEPTEARVTLGVDGEIALETETLPVQRGPRSTTSLVFYEMNIPEATYSSFLETSSSQRCWTAEETARFYRALRIFGTDFDLMTTAFPNRTHKNLKNKFKREERDNRELVQKIINEPTKFNLEAFGDEFSEPNEPEPNQ